MQVNICYTNGNYQFTTVWISADSLDSINAVVCLVLIPWAKCSSMDYKIFNRSIVYMSKNFRSNLASVLPLPDLSSLG